MKLAYIAGPFRAATPWLVEQNIRRAEQLAHYVWMQGVAALCPHTNTRFFNGEGPDELWLDGTMEMLRRCDVLVLVEGWERSSGTAAEVAEARRLGIPVLALQSEFDDWLKEAAERQLADANQRHERWRSARYKLTCLCGYHRGRSGMDIGTNLCPRCNSFIGGETLAEWTGS